MKPPSESPRKVIPIAPVAADGSNAAAGRDRLPVRSAKKVYRDPSAEHLPLALGDGISPRSWCFLGCPGWSGGQRQMVLFDLGARRRFIFGLVLYPQDFIYPDGFADHFSALAVLFTAVAGRLWCGFSCPQRCTPKFFCGSSTRSKVIAVPVCAWTTAPDVREDPRSSASRWCGSRWPCGQGLLFCGLLHPFASWAASCWRSRAVGIFWVLFYGFATYGNAGFMREQVRSTCPYGFPERDVRQRHLIVTYDESVADRVVRARRRWIAMKGHMRAIGTDCTLCQV